MYVPLHPVFSSGHTCTHIVLKYGEYNNRIAYETGMRRTRVYSVIRKDYLPTVVIRFKLTRSTQAAHGKIVNEELHGRKSDAI